MINMAILYKFREKFMKGSHKVLQHLYVMIVVILSYAILAVTSMNVKNFSTVPDGNYQYLTESFLQGHTYFNIAPPKALLALKDPYNYELNSHIFFPDGVRLHARLHDASLYANKFYLYFGPLPVITFYIPCKLLTGFYPPDCFAVFLFLSIGFIICYVLLNKIQQNFFPEVSSLMMGFCGLVLGFANNAPFLLMRPSFYEVAISSAFCFVSASIFFLYRIFYYRFQMWDIVWFSIMLGLSTAARPHFVFIAIAIIPFLIFYMYKYGRLSFAKLCAFSPIVIIGVMLLAYNQARFHSLFEFGQSYQLIFYSHGLLAKLKYFDLQNFGFNLYQNFYNYFLRHYVTINSFPYVFFPDLMFERVEHQNIYEGSFGLLKTVPFVLLVLLLPLKYVFYHQQQSYRPLFDFIGGLIIITLMIILFLLSLNSSTQRYISDFSTFLIMLSILSLWCCYQHVSENILRFLKLFFILTGIFSIYLGIIAAKNFSFVGWYVRGLDLSLANYLIFFSFVTIQIILMGWLMRRKSP